METPITTTAGRTPGACAHAARAACASDPPYTVTPAPGCTGRAPAAAVRLAALNEPDGRLPATASATAALPPRGQRDAGDDRRAPPRGGLHRQRPADQRH